MFLSETDKTDVYFFPFSFFWDSTLCLFLADFICSSAACPRLSKRHCRYLISVEMYDKQSACPLYENAIFEQSPWLRCRMTSDICRHRNTCAVLCHRRVACAAAVGWCHLRVRETIILSPEFWSSLTYKEIN